MNICDHNRAIQGHDGRIVQLDQAIVQRQDLRPIRILGARRFENEVQVGMEALVSPSTVAKEEFGYMRGTVISVGEFPTTYEGMFRVLKNEDLVNALRAGGAPIEVRISLVPDPGSPSGYTWTSPQGPPSPIQNGTPAGATITVKQSRPISLVLPFIQ